MFGYTTAKQKQKQKQKQKKQTPKHQWFNMLNNYFSLPQYEEDHLHLVPKDSNT